MLLDQGLFVDSIYHLVKPILGNRLIKRGGGGLGYELVTGGKKGMKTGGREGLEMRGKEDKKYLRGREWRGREGLEKEGRPGNGGNGWGGREGQG